MEPVDLLKRAVAAVEEADVPEDLRTLAFAKALDLLVSGKPSQSEDKNSGKSTSEGGGCGHQRDDFASRIAAKIDVSPTLVDRIFDEHEEDLIFSGDVSGLGKSRNEKVHALTLLLLAGRRWAGLDTGGVTQDGVLRAEIDRHGLLDVSNYSRQISVLKPYITITGSGKSGSYKIKYDGLEKAKQLARSMAGAE
jgi:hypothetical protein